MARSRFGLILLSEQKAKFRGGKLKRKVRAKQAAFAPRERKRKCAFAYF
jgi:hypothetical protein